MTFAKTSNGELEISDTIKTVFSRRDINNQRLATQSTIASRTELLEKSKAELAELEKQLLACDRLGITV